MSEIEQQKRAKTPTILQMEAVECGAASLAMVLAYYGRYVPLEELRIACGVSRDGSKASNILKAARKYGMEAKGFRKEPASLKSMKGPMILHWNFNHFIVLEGFQKGKVYINDPANGRKTISEEELDQSFTGVVLTFEKGEGFKKGGSKPSTINALKKRASGSSIALTYIVLVGLALVIPGLVIPTFSKIFVDDVLLGGKDKWLTPLLWGMGLTIALKGLLTWIQQYYLLKLETKIAISSSGKFLWHVLRLPVEFFSQRYAGDISSRMQSNDKVASILSEKVANAALNAVTVIFYFILMLQFDVGLTFLAVGSVLLNIIYLRLETNRRIDMNNKLVQYRGKMHGTAMSGLKVIETLKATGSESDFFSKWSGYFAKTADESQKIGVFTQIASGIPSFLTSLTNTIILIVGGLRIMDGTLTVGSLVAFQSLAGSFLEPVNQLVEMGNVLNEVQADMNRLDDIFNYPADVPDNALEAESSGEFPDKLEGYVEIKDLTYGYNILEPPLIEGFNLSLKPGSRVALVGGSGSGKSTIAKLIAGLYKPWSGEICFDGKRRDQIPKAIINNSLSVVDQDISMFSGTIKDNVSLWDSTIPELDIIRAAKDACIHDDIAAKAGGYDFLLNEGGTNFSGGQRQRLEIARALSNNPSIIILDEATSALDPMTENMVDENIRRRGCTCIIVAHRLSTIRDCDEIIVLERGKIVQRGTHDVLKAIEGPYAALIKAI